MCRLVPFTLATDCKSLYDICQKNGSLPEEKRIALDIMDIKESISEFGDSIRWVPTDHMLSDSLTKDMPTDVLMEFLRSMQYALKYDETVATKRTLRKQRKAARLASAEQALAAA